MLSLLVNFKLIRSNIQTNIIKLNKMEQSVKPKIIRFHSREAPVARPIQVGSLVPNICKSLTKSLRPQPPKQTKQKSKQFSHLNLNQSVQKIESTPKLRNSKFQLSIHPEKKEHYSKLKTHSVGYIDGSRGSIKCILCQRQLKIYRFNFHKCEDCQSYAHIRCYNALPDKNDGVCCKKSYELQKNMNLSKRKKMLLKREQKMFSSIKLIKIKLLRIREDAIAEQMSRLPMEMILEDSPEMRKFMHECRRYIWNIDGKRVLRFPIADSLFKQYRFLDKLVVTQELPEFNVLSDNFGDYLELWNLYSSVPLYFKKWSVLSFQNFTKSIKGSDFSQLITPLLVLHLQALNTIFSKLLRKLAHVKNITSQQFRSHQLNKLLKPLTHIWDDDQLLSVLKLRNVGLKMIMQILRYHVLWRVVKMEGKPLDDGKPEYVSVYDYTVGMDVGEREDGLEAVRRKYIKIIFALLNNQQIQVQNQKVTVKDAGYLQQAHNKQQLQQCQKLYKKLSPNYRNSTQNSTTKSPKQSLNSTKQLFQSDHHKINLIKLLLNYLYSKTSFKRIIRQFRNASIEQRKRYKLVFDKYKKCQRELAKNIKLLKEEDSKLSEMLVRGRILEKNGGTRFLEELEKSKKECVEKIRALQEEIEEIGGYMREFKDLLVQYQDSTNLLEEERVYEFEIDHKVKLLGTLDRANRKSSFWKIDGVDDRIFIHHNNSWGYYSLDQTEQLLNCLNFRAKQQNKLYHNLLQFKLRLNKSQILNLQKQQKNSTRAPPKKKPPQTKLSTLLKQITEINPKTICPLVEQIHSQFYGYAAKFGYKQSRAEKKCLELGELGELKDKEHIEYQGVENGIKIFEGVIRKINVVMLMNRELQIWAYPSLGKNWRNRFKYSRSVAEKCMLILLFCVFLDKCVTREPQSKNNNNKKSGNQYIRSNQNKRDTKNKDKLKSKSKLKNKSKDKSKKVHHSDSSGEYIVQSLQDLENQYFEEEGEQKYQGGKKQQGSEQQESEQQGSEEQRQYQWVYQQPEEQNENKYGGDYINGSQLFDNDL